MNSFFLAAFAVAVLVANVSSHMAMVHPPSRGSAWRVSADWPIVWPQDDTDWCRLTPSSRKSHCGICGPIYNNNVQASERITIGKHYNQTHFSFEKGGPFYTGKIAATFKKGQVVPTRFIVKMLAGNLFFFMVSF